ncbi:MAG: ABC transporter ATP-binding protein [Methyloceanibacter sp.]|uniref:ABC transporter ATP-binding protein n=1 Tax=Methyloceanibacter sp. TaxID=1965321 RepID=UPI003EE31DCD
MNVDQVSPGGTAAAVKPIISFRNICKRWGSTVGVDHVSLDIEPGEFFALLGPSGCGKTTLLRMLAGLEVPTEGQVLIDGQDMGDIPPNKRAVNMVFQSYAVFPHMTVADNVAYGLKIDRVPQPERAERVQEALELVQLGQLADRKPDQLSGGQRQRVALARALVKKPKVLLLDEPLSALDAKLLEAMRFELSQLQQKVGITFIMVTHDQNEALAIASRIAVMNKGSIAQLGTPSDLYEFPASRFVADFIGSVNMFEGTLIDDQPDEATVKCPELEPHRIHVPHAVLGQESSKVWVAIRPEKMNLHKDADAPPTLPECPPAHNVAKGEIKEISYLGDISIFHVLLANGALIRISRPNRSRFDQDDFGWGEKVWVSWGGTSPVVLQG